MTQTRSIHGTPHTLQLTFDYDAGDEDCESACSSLAQASADEFCDGCDQCVTDDSHVQNCPDAITQINRQKGDFCGSGKAANVSKVAAVPAFLKDDDTVPAFLKDDDACRLAYRAGCWNEPPFNSGCCATCTASTGMESCDFNHTRAQGGSHLEMHGHFEYDPDDDNCNKACNEIVQAIWIDFCPGNSQLDKNDKVKHCDAAVTEIHHQVNDVLPDWCPSKLTEQTV